jgi:hypothetical protein
MIQALLLLFLSQLSQAQSAANTISIGDKAVAVATQIEFILDDSRIPQRDFQMKIREWERTLNTAWNRHSFKFGQKKVRFDFRVSSAINDSSAMAHHIRVVFGQRTSEGRYAAYVQRKENPFGPHSGVFPIQISVRTLIHEVGHLLNLDDEYWGTKVDQPPEPVLFVNGVTLVPTRLGRVVLGYRNVSYGVSPGKSGVMGHHSYRVWDYYVKWILETLVAEN